MTTQRGPDFKRFSTMLRGVVRNPMVWRDEGTCPECKLLRVAEHPDIVAELLADGFPMERIQTARCKCAERLAERRYNVLRDAGLPHPLAPRTFSTFKYHPGVTHAVTEASRFARSPGAAILVLSGPPGSGKSHLLEAIGREALTRNQSVRYEYGPELLDDLRGSYGEDGGQTTNAIMERLVRPMILLLDDIGIGSASPWVQERLTRIIDDRYRSGTSWRLAVAMNLTRAEVETRLGDRIASRLFDTESGLVETVTLACGDYRAAPVAR